MAEFVGGVATWMEEVEREVATAEIEASFLLHTFDDSALKHQLPQLPQLLLEAFTSHTATCTDEQEVGSIFLFSETNNVQL